MSGPIFDDDDIPEGDPAGATFWDASDHDGIIAERFELLDRLNPPPIQDLTTQTPPPAAFSAAPIAERRTPLFALVASAAALLIIGGLSISSLLGDGEEEVEATEGDRAAPADQSDALVDEDRSSGELGDGDRQTDEDPAMTVQDESEDQSETDAEPEGQNVDDSDQDGQGPGQEDDEPGEDTGSTTSQDDQPQQSTPETTVAEPSSTTSTSTTLDDASSPTVTAAVPEEPDGADSGQGNGPVTVIRGILTEVFTDCQSHLVFTQDGTVESLSPITCDGGSYIVVDGRRIRTSAGFVPEEDYFDKHPEDLTPGDSVMVQARENDGGELSLDCDPCSVRSR